MKRASWWLGMVLVVASGSAGCHSNGENVRNVVLTGSHTMAPLLEEIGQRFEASHPGVRIDIQRDGSDRGIEDTRKGLADVGMVARALRPEDAPLYPFVIAGDGLALLVHRDNPITALTDEQVTRVFARGITNWNQLGGNDASLILISRTVGSSAETLFLDHYKLKATQVRADRVVGSSTQIIQSVAGLSNAIGVVSIGPAAAAIQAGTPVRLLPCDGVEATLANVRKGTYPLTRPLTLVTRDAPRGLTQELIEFARSDAVRDLVEKHQFIPLAP